MKHFFLFISCLILVTLGGCRAKRELKASEWHAQSSELEVQSRKIDSLSTSMAERKTIRIEYYQPEAYSADTVSQHSIGIGAVKSIVIETEKSGCWSAITATDSVVEVKNVSESDFKSVDESQAKERFNTLPLAVCIASLIVAACSFILYRRRKKA